MTKIESTANYIRKKIADNYWKVGDVLPNTADLAKEIGVSKFTLREAIRPLVEEGIIDRKPKIGTIVLRKCDEKQGFILAIGSMRFSNNYIGGYVERTLIDKTQKYLSEKGVEFKAAIGVGYTTNDIIDSMHIFDNSILSNTIGVLNLLSYFPTEEFEKRNIPVVSFSPLYTGTRSEVIVDLHSIFKGAIDMLLCQNFKKILILNVDFMANSKLEGEYSVGKDLTIQSFFDKMKKEYSNLDVLNFDVSKATFAYIFNTFKDYMNENKDIDAIFIADDNLIPEVENAIRSLKLNIPNDLKILAWTNKGRDYGFDMSWTRFEQDLDEAVESIYKLLIEQINGNMNSNKVSLLPKFIKGNSL